MNHYKQEKKKQILALGSSLVLHIMCLIGAYYFLFKPAASYTTTAYRVRINRLPIQDDRDKPQQESALPDNPVAAPIKQVMATSPIGKVEILESTQKHEPIIDPIKPPEEVKQLPPLAEEVLPQEQESLHSETIDERSLYQGNDPKQTGASLELVGWLWDSAPQPQDSTSETGKIVFEITIDDVGEVIAVKTLEKTISPLVEQLYKEAVAKLTFSKIAPNQAYTPKAIGKITFIIKAK
jgi:hypothetical protein